ncbi:MAG: inositol monophosphatase [Duodenibacillus sp.]|jgi:myo-inositol-1(or 4)-monophosphatase|nr:inositol monophosphatase [Duodenibacillus sp.]
MASAQLEVAIKAALKAGQIISRESRNLDGIDAQEKAQFDFVTRVDLDCQRAICDMIQRYFPRDGILAEEGGVRINPNAQNVWIIDPLDGTTNFMHGFPQYAVSIALAVKGRVVVAVVYDPNRNELFTAERGQGAFLNNKRIRVSGRKDFEKALIGTGFPFRATDNYTAFMPKFERVARSTAGLRRAGAASLDLAYVACGRLDGFWESNLATWDLAAGSLLVLEAGGLVTDLSGGEQYLQSGNICVGTPRVFANLLALVGDIKTPVA